MKPRLLLLFLALRLAAWAFLLPPWGGFDEVYHHGYVETCADKFGWYAFNSVTIPDRLVGSLQRWPLFSGYARQFHARDYGSSTRPSPQPVLERNYETLQSPAYYNFAGAIVRIAPDFDPVVELYGLRLVNASMAFLVGLCVLAAARRSGFESRAWLPVAFLAFLPGYTLALVRVSNDALCALLVSISIAALVGSAGNGGEGRRLAATLSAGVSPWTKLYGWAAVPAVGYGLWKSAPRRRLLYLFALLAPGALLALLSISRNGAAFSLLETLEHPRPAGLLEIPWLRDSWTIVKSHLWVSGMSTLVFPNLVYLILAAALVLLLAETAAAARRFRSDPFVAELPALAIAIGVFALELAYFSWKNFAYYRAPGGAGGWYLWAVALPETLLLAWGLSRSERLPAAFGLFLGSLLLLTAAGDCVLFLEVSGSLVLAPGNHHILGVEAAPVGRFFIAFLESRPRPAAIAALFLAPASWMAGLVFLARTFVRPASRGGRGVTIAAGGVS